MFHIRNYSDRTYLRVHNAAVVLSLYWRGLTYMSIRVLITLPGVTLDTGEHGHNTMGIYHTCIAVRMDATMLLSLEPSPRFVAWLSLPLGSAALESAPCLRE